MSFHDLGQDLYLAEGDQISESIGRNLKYTFGGQVSLHSREPIEIKDRDREEDRQLGKVTFKGNDEEVLSPRFHDLSAVESTLFSRACGRALHVRGSPIHPNHRYSTRRTQ